jgi:hypothetical protein
MKFELNVIKISLKNSILKKLEFEKIEKIKLKNEYEYEF